MSWMDSWSRPSANSKVPAPLYLAADHAPYCQTCGRVMNSKKTAKKQSNETKYCSDRCRGRKPGAKDRQIERAIAALLNGEEDSGIEKTGAKSRVVKGDPRLIVTCEEIESVIFGSRFDPEKVYGRRKNRKTRAIGDPNAVWKSVDMQSDNEANADHDSSADDSDHTAPSTEGGIPVIDNFNISHVRPSQQQSDINFSAGGGERSKAEKIEESAEDLEKRRQGAKRAEEREIVRRAARRAIVFGVEVPRREPTVQKSSKSKTKSKRGAGTDDEADTATTETRKAEAIMSGLVVEPSYAKGNWSIRWRE